TLYVDPGTLGEVLIADLAELVPGHDAEPLRLLAGVIVAVLPGAVARHPERGDRAALSGVAHLRIGAEMAGELHLVQVLSHGSPPRCTSTLVPPVPFDRVASN